jgi:hypothetical protein
MPDPHYSEFGIHINRSGCVDDKRFVSDLEKDISWHWGSARTAGIKTHDLKRLRTLVLVSTLAMNDEKDQPLQI